MADLYGDSGGSEGKPHALVGISMVATPLVFYGLASLFDGVVGGILILIGGVSWPLIALFCVIHDSRLR